MHVARGRNETRFNIFKTGKPPYVVIFLFPLAKPKLLSMVRSKILYANSIVGATPGVQMFNVCYAKIHGMHGLTTN